MRPDEQDSAKQPLDDVLDPLRAFDPWDLLTRLAGLHLVPENRGFALRLTFASNLVACLPIEGQQPRASKTRLTSWLDTSVADAVGHLDDPPEEMFATAMTFIGGSYLLLPPASGEIARVLRLLASAIFSEDDPSELGTPFLSAAQDLILGTLRLSDEILRRAGFTRSASMLAPNPAAQIRQPFSVELRSLGAACTFQEDQLCSFFGGASMDSGVVSHFVLELGATPLDGVAPGGGPLARRPIVTRGHGTYLVALPSQLATACCQALYDQAATDGVMDVLSSRFRGVVEYDVRLALARLGHTYVRPSPTSDAAQPSALYSLDDDKALHVQIVTPPLRPGLDLSDDWTADLNDATQLFMSAADRLLSESIVNAVLGLTVIQTDGRAFTARAHLSGDATRIHLLMTGDSLETISRAAMGTQLELLKFSRARAELRRSTDAVASFSVLDEYAIWAGAGRTFHIEHGPAYTAVFFHPGGGTEVKNQVAAQDIHGARSWDGQSVLEVERYWSGPIPIFVSTRPTLTVSLLVEAGGQQWVRLDEDGGSRSITVGTELVETTAYWLWQIRQHLADPDEDSLVTVSIRIDELPDELPAEEDGDVPPVEIQRVAERHLLAIFHAQFFSALFEETNEAERLLVSALIGSIPTAANQPEASVDLIAPRGPRRMMRVLTREEALLTDTSGLPPARWIDGSESSSIADLGASILAGVMGEDHGPVSPDRLPSILNDLVGHLLRELLVRVSTLAGTGAVEFLVAHQEALVAKRVRAEVNLSGRLACFGEYEDVTVALREDSSRATASAIASRFLLEVVAATPPTGVRPISLDFYDELLELASTITELGSASDLYHFGLTDPRAEIAECGHLVLRSTDHTDALDRFARSAVEDLIERETNERPASIPEAVRGRIGAAFQAEFGFRADELRLMIEALCELADDTSDGVNTVDADTLVELVADSTGTSENGTSAMINALVMKPRETFIPPDAPYRRTDVYPWRFGRELSYLRRPLVRRGDEIVYGRRSVLTSFRYIVNQCVSGRRNARTGAMRRAIGELHEAKGEAFNDAVADLIGSVDRYRVFRRVKKVAGRRLADSDGNRLGDIDVLVCDYRRHMIVAIEAKDFSVSRTPAEYQHHVEELFVDSPKRRSAATKHSRRVSWLRDHIDAVLSHFGLEEEAGRWTVMGSIILDEDLLARYLHTSEHQVLTWRELKTTDPQGWFL